MVKKKGITTPDILPGEPGWDKYIADKKKAKEATRLKTKKVVKKAPRKVGNISTGNGGLRIGREVRTYTGVKKYPVWRYRRQVGEIVVDTDDDGKEEIELTFIRLGSIANHRRLIQDVDFQKKWDAKEKELLDSQGTCHLCNKKISKTAKPNLFHYNIFKKRALISEEAAKVPSRVVSGELTLEEGWSEFNNVLETGNKYYMSLEETALVCASCAKSRGLDIILE
jgi:hypothetical protein